ncbi:MAG: helix-turn-helix transcriptional regulator [Deltaproteobacteria bacterium]|nr:helix-turn-helix transcriptional regulator [Deltaproteobacteria bacterium]
MSGGATTAQIREVARQRGLLLSHVPDRAGVSRSHFRAVMQGRKSPTLDWVERISASLELDPVALLNQPVTEVARPARGTRAPRGTRRKG